MPFHPRARVCAVAAAARALAVAAALVAAPALGGCSRPVFHDASQLTGTPLDPAKTAYDFVLTDGRGRPAHVVVPHVRLTFLFFGYTHCPDECPLALASLARAYRSLPPAHRTRTRIVFVSVDPARDTPAAMRRYVTSFGAPVVGLTGTRSELEPVWNAYGVSVDPRSHEIGHGDTIYAIEDGARVILVYPPDAKASDLASDAMKLTLAPARRAAQSVALAVDSRMVAR